MDANRLRAWWAARQGLDGSLQGQTPAAVLERIGWARSVAGVNPYLTLFARAGTARADADEAVAALDMQELPAARGCTYIVPASGYALALRCGWNAAQAPRKVAGTLGVGPKEIDALCEAIVLALRAGPLDPDGLREAVGGACRNLGAAGVKKGMSTTLPLGLGLLQADGKIRRVPVNGRLDQQRYRYTLWNPPTIPLADDAVFPELARHFFRWIGPARLADFQWFSGLSGKAAQAAISSLGLVSLDGGLLLLPEDADSFRAFRPSAKPEIQLLASLDGLIHLRRDHASLLDGVDGLPANIGHLADLPSHAITDRGHLIGLWEFDPGTGTIVWITFTPPPKEIEPAVARTQEFILGQVGDARAFSLDSPKSRAPRLAALRAASR